ncbi:MAG: histidine phosphatase family protein [Pseudomonadota bacterium]
MAQVRYLSHPQVIIDPNVPVPDWGLNDVGAARVAALAGAPALAHTVAVYASTETKATETGAPLAAAIPCPLLTRNTMGENDRSATGFLPGPEFEAVADQFFAHPAESIRGWERAVDAQARIVAAVEAALAEAPPGDILLVGHGGVGTLLWCHLAGEPIRRLRDQPPGGGNWYAFDRESRALDGAWAPMERLL